MGLTISVREVSVGAEAWALPGWETLLERSVSNVLFLSRTFQSHWWEALGEGDLRVLVGSQGEASPLFIAPLSISQVEGLGRTVWPVGGSEVADYLDIIAAPEDVPLAWRQVFEWLRTTREPWDVLDLPALPEWSPSRQVVAQLAAEYGWSCRESIDNVCPIITLAPTWEGYLAGLRKKDRHELRRKIGRLERLATSERFWMVSADDDLAAVTAEFFALHRKSGQAKHDFWTARLEHFFERLIQATHANGWLRLGFQEINGTLAAAVLAFRYGNRYYVYNSGYDPAYRELGGGVVCMARMIQAAIAEGVAVFDLLQGDEAYKYDFGATNTNVYRCRVQRAL